MTKQKKAQGITVRVLDLADAKREFALRRTRTTKYGGLLDQASKLKKGKALVVQGVQTGEVAAIRKRIGEVLGQNWKVNSARTGEGVYDVLLSR